MKNYDYWRDAWPAIVRDCFAHGGRMFAVEEQRNEAGHVTAYRPRRELSEAEALEYRGATVTMYGDSNTKE